MKWKSMYSGTGRCSILLLSSIRNSLDREARRLGVTRQSLIKLWLADKLGQPAAAAKR